MRVLVAIIIASTSGAGLTLRVTSTKERVVPRNWGGRWVPASFEAKHLPHLIFLWSPNMFYQYSMGQELNRFKHGRKH